MNRTKKFLLNILLPLFAGIVVFAVGLIIHNSQTELPAYAQESYGSDTLAVFEKSSYVIADTSSSDYSSNYSLRAFIGSDYASSLGTSEWTTERYEDTGHGKMAVLQKRLIGHIMALRTKELSGYAGSSYSSVNFQSLFTVYEFDSSLFPDYSYVSARGEVSPRSALSLIPFTRYIQCQGKRKKHGNIRRKMNFGEIRASQPSGISIMFSAKRQLTINRSV